MHSEGIYPRLTVFPGIRASGHRTLKRLARPFRESHGSVCRRACKTRRLGVTRNAGTLEADHFFKLQDRALGV